MWLYNILISLYTRCISLAGRWYPKAKLWSNGREGLFERMAEAIKSDDRVVWIHTASLGEFEQGRPVIEKIRARYPEYKILLTFFSPSGYEIRKNYQGADYIFYLPADTKQNARRFLDIAHPEVAIFVKYEFWLNLLTELRKRQINSYITSSIFRSNSVFFRWYGSLWRKALRTFKTIFVQNEESKKLLADIGFENVIIAGDSRFDRVAEIARQAKKIDLIDRFRGGSKLFVAGSTWGPDEDILIQLINDNPTIKFIIAPHEMEEERMAKIEAEVKGGALRYTRCAPLTSFGSKQVLILDTMGMLSSVYGYASWSYIGGGFGVGIHNTLEAATFGLPIAFGPNYHKFKEARDLVDLGAAASVIDHKQLARWFAPLRDNEVFLRKVSRLSREYTQKNQGATDIFLKEIFG